MGLELAVGVYLGTAAIGGHMLCGRWAPCSVPSARVYPNLWVTERLASIRPGVDTRVSHPPSLVFRGPTVSWREGWVMPRAQDILLGEQPCQALPKK